MNRKRIITTSKKTAEAIFRQKDSITMFGRSISIETIKHCPGYSDVCINESEKLEPQDYFWLGYFTRGEDLTNKI